MTVERYAEFCEKCHKADKDAKDLLLQAYKRGIEEGKRLGRQDAFEEIAYSDCVEKEPFEILAYEKGRADIKVDIAQECHYLLNSGMGKQKSLEHLIRILEKKEGVGG